MKAMILAAGEGTRLRPLTTTLPKPLVPIVGMPLLEHTLRWLSLSGVTEAALNLFHRPLAIPAYFGSDFAGVRLHYFYEDELRGTSGGLKAAEAIFRDAPFFVIYGDNLVQADLHRLFDFHTAHGGFGTLGLFQHPNPTAAGIVGTDSEGRITRFVEKPPAGEVFSDLANAGVYVLDPVIFDAIPSGRPSDFGRDIFPQLLDEGKSLYGTPLGGYLQDTGTPVSYRQANWDCLAGKTGLVFDNPDLWIAPTAHIGRDVTFVGRNLIGAETILGDGAIVNNSILWDSVTVAPGEQISNTIVASGGKRADIVP